MDGKFFDTDKMDDHILPSITIIIPVKPDGYVKALEAVKSLNYPSDRLEVFVAEGKQPSRQRNDAAKQAKGEILYFLDDDACPDPGNLERIARHFRDKAVAVVGGPSITPESDSFLQQCFASVFTSPFGGAGIRNRYRRTGQIRKTSEKELILCNLSFRAELFMKAGGLNEKLYPNEENELMDRIKRAGHALLHDPDLFVYRSQRKDLKAFVRQVLNYGRGRMEQTMIDFHHGSLAHFIPMVFLVYFITLPFIGNILYRTPFLCYSALVLLSSGAVALQARGFQRRKPGAFVCLGFLFPLLHLGYGAGMFWGLMRSILPVQGETAPPVIRKIA